MNKNILRAVVASVAIAPMMALGAGISAAAPTTSAGGAGEIILTPGPLDLVMLCTAETGVPPATKSGSGVVWIGTPTPIGGLDAASAVTGNCFGLGLPGPIAGTTG